MYIKKGAEEVRLKGTRVSRMGKDIFDDVSPVGVENSSAFYTDEKPPIPMIIAIADSAILAERHRLCVGSDESFKYTHKCVNSKRLLGSADVNGDWKPQQCAS